MARRFANGGDTVSPRRPHRTHVSSVPIQRYRFKPGPCKQVAGIFFVPAFVVVQCAGRL